jgi:hypothetical protein
MPRRIVTTLAGGGAFSPASVAGLALWLDAADAATLFQDAAGTTPATADTDPVGLWADKSAAGRDGSAATTVRPALKLAIQAGRNVVRGDGSDDKLTLASGLALGDFSVYVAQKTTGDCAFLGAAGDTNNQVRIGQSGNNVLSAFDGSNNPQSTTLGSARTVFTVVEYHRTGTTLEFFQDGTAYGTGTLSGTRNFDQVGALAASTLPFAGDLGEVLVWSAYHAVATRAQVRAYLRQKWSTL